VVILFDKKTFLFCFCFFEHFEGDTLRISKQHQVKPTKNPKQCLMIDDKIAVQSGGNSSNVVSSVPEEIFQIDILKPKNEMCEKKQARKKRK